MYYIINWNVLVERTYIPSKSRFHANFVIRKLLKINAFWTILFSKSYSGGLLWQEDAKISH